jgi:hypothetical protein
MTPKEKAKELVNKYWIILEKELPAKRHICEIKECALLAVDELIKETGSKYYYDVKHEIEKL